MIPSILNIKTFLLVLAGGFFPAIIWLWFWLKEDRKNPEPKRLILGTFLAGGLSVFLAFYLEQQVTSNFDLTSLENLSVSFSPLKQGIIASYPYFALFFRWAVIEESVKYVAAALIALRGKNFDEPIDSMVYMITAALGFAALENSLFLFKTLRIGLGGFEFLINGNLRFVGASLLHISSSAIVGLFIASSFQQKGIRKIVKVVIGLLTASVLHALFNFFIIINNGQNIFRILITLWVFIIVILFLFEKIKRIKLPYVQR